MNTSKTKINKINKKIDAILESNNIDLTELTYLISKRKHIQSCILSSLQKEQLLTNDKIIMYEKKDSEYSCCELHYLIFNKETREQVGYILYLGKNNIFYGAVSHVPIGEYTYKEGIKEVYVSVLRDNIPSIKTVKKFSGTQISYTEREDVLVFKCDLNLLKNKSLDNIQINNNTISGNITTEESGLLFLSIPYNDGFKAFVNGKETNILKANIGYMALELNSGENNILFGFKSKNSCRE